MTNQNLPQHFRFISPIIQVLRSLGGSGRSSEVTDLVIERLNISEDELEDLLQSGQSRIKNQIHWARMVLVKIGFIDSSQRGVWSLTEKGFNTDLSKDDLLSLYHNRRQWMGIGDRKQKKEVELTAQEITDDVENDNLQESIDYKADMVEHLSREKPIHTQKTWANNFHRAFG
ncbi:winged helix-turn-helix domain-containing protein [Desulfosarcina ovata]|uniref:Restriction system protein Mrr-like N-terminal domain-containing protein n=1 Tax=Desulfosarcina ovata subsp. ovata TaxID=2752305 RepID=A0A5K8AH16_9BACT|nr:winged helix-turn-helix domain-containing protein [Desulfosarcina ovata]BBO91972.1 hypothetical protein DSCOOX_51520 [Desulfosarcina ovata subsp. ovata]